MSSDGLHGQKKVPVNPEKQKKDLLRAKEYDANVCQVLLKRGHAATLELLDETLALLRINPEFYTLWNFRRECAVAVYQVELGQQQPNDRFDEFCKTELKALDEILKKAPKSYWVWNHRRWILENCPNPRWEKELAVINFMLDLDARNFHGWDYRRYVVGKSGLVSPQAEFEYTQTKIQQNFSNYSAWHYRSKLLPRAFPQMKDLDAQLASDLDFVRNALFTEPSDQSAWLYQRFILGDLVLPFLAYKQTSRLPSRMHVFKVDQRAGEGFDIPPGVFAGSALDQRSSRIQLGASEWEGLWPNTFTELHIEADGKDAFVRPMNSQPRHVWESELAQLKELEELEPDNKCSPAD
ncbi:hypothetical protein HDU91_005912 [Kappamyces sp. JEL0680]|nr:hypothetical protein HDU91_005912 [Kappamyces sp. JEL0680]